MTLPLSDVAVRYAPLLRALDEGEAQNPTDLAERAGIMVGNIHRSLDKVEAAGLIRREAGGPKHVAALTPLALRALEVLDMAESGQGVGHGAGQRRVPLIQIAEDTANPRSDLDTEEARAGIADLADSIAEPLASGRVRDVLQPVRLRPHGEFGFRLVAGHRRYRACCLAVADGRLPSDYAIPAVVEEMTDEEAEEAAIIENVQREDMHWMDEAEAFLKLHLRGWSAARIEALIGRRRSKRSVQDFVQLARDLSAEDKARTRLKRDDPNHLKYDAARYLVGQKAFRPAADLGDRLALALLEVAVAGAIRPTIEGLEPGYVELRDKPRTGPLVTLQDRGLINLKPQAGKVFARALGMSAARKYLAELGFFDAETGLSRDIAGLREALKAARARVLPKDTAEALPVEPFLTAELNLQRTEAVTDPAPGSTAGQDPGFFDGGAAGVVTPNEARAREGLLQLAPAKALAILELAHALQRRGEPRIGGFMALMVDPAAVKGAGAAFQDLVYDRLIFSVSQGKGDVQVSLSPTAIAWLNAQDVPKDEDGAPVFDAAIYAAQEAVAGIRGDLADGYMTDWLNAAGDVPEDGLDDRLRIALIEIAHAASVTRRGHRFVDIPGMSIEVFPRHTADEAAIEALVERGLINFARLQTQWPRVSVSSAGDAWFEALGHSRDAAQQFWIGTESFKRVGVPPPPKDWGKPRYITPWLNAPNVAPEGDLKPPYQSDLYRQIRESEDGGEDAHGVRAEPVGDMSSPFEGGMRQVSRARASALHGLISAVALAIPLIERAKTRKLDAAEAELVLTRLSAARDAARAALPEENV